MDQQMYDMIKQAAYEDELSKIAGVGEVVKLPAKTPEEFSSEIKAFMEKVKSKKRLSPVGLTAHHQKYNPRWQKGVDY